MRLRTFHIVLTVICAIMVGGLLVWQGPGPPPEPVPQSPAPVETVPAPSAQPPGAPTPTPERTAPQVAPARPIPETPATRPSGSAAVSLSGTVTGKASGQPLEGAEVEVRVRTAGERTARPQAQTATSDAKGKFELRGLPAAAAYVLLASAPGYGRERRAGDLPKEGALDLGVLALRPALSLSGRVVSTAGQPVAAARVQTFSGADAAQQAARETWKAYAATRTSPEGDFVFEQLAAGAYALRVSAPGYATAVRSDVHVAPSRKPRLEIVLSPNAILAGVIRAGAGKAVEGAYVTASPYQASRQWRWFGRGIPAIREETISDRQGRYRFDSLGIGRYTVRVEALGYAPSEQTNVATGRSDVDFELSAGGVLHGSVVKKPDDSPVPEATVSGQGPRGWKAEVKTDPTGRFRVEHVPVGSVTLTATASDLAPEKRSSVTVSEGRETAVSFVLSPGSTIAGRVYLVGENQPLPDIEVQLSGQQSLNLKTGDDGRYRLEHLAAGEYRLQVTAERYYPVTPTRRLLIDWEQQYDDLDFQMGAAGWIEGVVTDPDGEVLGGASVSARRVQKQTAYGFRRWGRFGSSSATARTDTDGRYVLKGLEPGSDYSVGASFPGYAPANRESVVVHADETTEVDLQLSVGGSLSGRVTSDEGDPVSNARIVVYGGHRGRGFSTPPSGTTDHEGHYTVIGLAAAKVSVRVEASGFVSASRSGIDVRAGEETRDVDFVLTVGAGLSGRITSAEGEPLPGAYVSAWGRIGRVSSSAMATSDDNGQYELTGLAPDATYRVHVRKTGYVPVQEQDVRIDRGVLDFVLMPAGAISGRVIEASGEPVTVFRIRASLESADGRRRGGGRSITVADRDGAFRIEDLQPGTYRLEATATGFSPTQGGPLQLIEGQPIEGVVITLTPGGQVSGVVLSKAERLPVAGATVRVKPDASGHLYADPAVTGIDGKFVLEHLPAGSLTLEATHPDYAAASKSCVVGEADRPVEEIELSQGGGIHGTVYDDQGAVIPDATINISGHERRRVTTDQDGYYEAVRLQPGQYTVMSLAAIHRERGIHLQSATVREDEMTRVDFGEAGTGCRLYGTVLSGGKPVQGVGVSLYLDAPTVEGALETHFKRSGADGSYSFAGLEPGYAVMAVSRRGWRSAAFALLVTIPEEQEKRLDVALPPGSLSGLVVTEAGNPLPGARVYARVGHPPAPTLALRRVQEQLYASTGTNREGRFTLPNLPAGKYLVQASGQGHAHESSTDLVLADGQALTDFEIRLGAPGRLILQLEDAQGLPVSGAEAFLTDERGSPVFSQSGWKSKRDGAATIPDLKAGTYTAAIWAEGLGARYLHGLAVVKGQETVMPAQLLPEAVLELTVTDEGGLPLAGAEPILTDQERRAIVRPIAQRDLFRGIPRFATDSQGVVRARGLPAGTYTLEVRRMGYQSHRSSVLLQSGLATMLRASLQP